MALDLSDIDLGELDSPKPAASNGTPLQLPLDAIDEDPNQPRTEFDQETLQELADNIKERGVRQPVSVRSHPTQQGRYMLNFGARRLRASRMAGKDTIPAFLDETANDFDQVAENEQRKGLTPLELALFVKKKLDEKMSQGEIARKLGKSRPLITYACALIDAPDWVMQAYRSGKCQGLFEINELRKFYEAHPEAVEQWGANQEAFTRSALAKLKVELSAPPAAPADINGSTQAVNGQSNDSSSTLVSGAVNGLPLRGALAVNGQESSTRPASASELVNRLPAQGADAVDDPESGSQPISADQLVNRLPVQGAQADQAAGQGKVQSLASTRTTGLRVVVQYGETLMEVATDAKPRKDRIPVRPLGSSESVQHIAPGKLQLVRVETV